MIEFTIFVLAAVVAQAAASGNETCHVTRRPNIGLSRLEDPAQILRIDYDAHVPEDCFMNCCNYTDELGRQCNAVSFYPVDQRDHVCVLLTCVPFANCVWMPSANFTAARIHLAPKVESQPQQLTGLEMTQQGPLPTTEGMSSVVVIATTQPETTPLVTTVPETVPPIEVPMEPVFVSVPSDFPGIVDWNVEQLDGIENLGMNTGNGELTTQEFAIDYQEEPLSQPEQPNIQPEQPIYQPEQPIYQPEQPINQPEQPINQPEQPFDVFGPHLHEGEWELEPDDTQQSSPNPEPEQIPTVDQSPFTPIGENGYGSDSGSKSRADIRHLSTPSPGIIIALCSALGVSFIVLIAIWRKVYDSGDRPKYKPLRDYDIRFEPPAASSALLP